MYVNEIQQGSGDVPRFVDGAYFLEDQNETLVFFVLSDSQPSTNHMHILSVLYPCVWRGKALVLISQLEKKIYIWHNIFHIIPL